MPHGTGSQKKCVMGVVDGDKGQDLKTVPILPYHGGQRHGVKGGAHVAF